jgi:hypothetical protein
VFAVRACDITPRCALEPDDGGEVRVEKIIRLIRACSLSIHDISRTQLDATSGLPRFNILDWSYLTMAWIESIHQAEQK